MTLDRAVMIAAAALAGGCPKPRVDRTCGHPPNQDACMGRIVAAKTQTKLVTDSARLAIDVLHDPRYRAEVARFIAAHAADSDLVETWGDATADALITQMRAELGGLQITTFGGPIGLIRLLAYGTRAFERRNPAEPIRLNRWALVKATPASVANTIVHELSHAIDLRHPHSSDPHWAIGLCEPPYVLGSLAEKVALGDAWQWTSAHCERLK